jgi:hypothetical protein
MDTTTAYTISETQRRQLRDLNDEYRDLNETINHAQASVDRAKKLNDINYHRRRRAIPADGHDDTVE